MGYPKYKYTVELVHPCASSGVVELNRASERGKTEVNVLKKSGTAELPTHGHVTLLTVREILNNEAIMIYLFTPVSSTQISSLLAVCHDVHDTSHDELSCFLLSSRHTTP